MKKSILSIVAIATLSTTFAQIPNASFETWTTVGSYETPDGWSTMNPTTNVASVYTATKGSPGNVGSYYLKLTSKTVGPTVVNGVAVSGVIDPVTMQPKSGFAYTGQPVSLTGKWQHMIMGSSQGSVSAMLTKWNSTTHQRETIATATQTLSGMAMSWSSFIINFTYTSSNVPDSAIILLAASGSAPTNNDYLYVDGLAFTGSVAGLPTIGSINSSINVFPNPTSDIVKVEINGSASKTATIELLDMKGAVISSKEVEVMNGTVLHTIDAKGLSKGQYIVKITSSEAVEERKIVIE